MVEEETWKVLKFGERTRRSINKAPRESEEETMRKFVFVFVLSIILVFSGTALAVNDADVGNFSPGAIANTGNNNTFNGAGSGPVTNQGGTGIGVGVGVGIGISDVDNKIINLNKPVNVFNPVDIQGQVLVNQPDQVIAPKQVVLFESPRDLLPAPYVGPSQIQILPGKMWRMADAEVPNIGIKPYRGEEYIKVESFNGSDFNRVRQEDLAEDLLTFRDRVLKKKGWTKDKVRIAVNVREAGESTSTSSGAAGSYSGNTTPASGVASTLGIFPGKARWKADYQYNPVFYLIKD
jgi:hypothetical protein